MRELTAEELALVAGGAQCNSDTDRWWQDAFDWLSTSLGWLGEATGGWLGDYIGGFGDVADSMRDQGDLIWDRASGYNDYCIDTQSDGGECMSFVDWNAAQGCP